jgi:hypothetical protein
MRLRVARAVLNRGATKVVEHEIRIADRDVLAYELGDARFAELFGRNDVRPDGHDARA